MAEGVSDLFLAGEEILTSSGKQKQCDHMFNGM